MVAPKYGPTESSQSSVPDAQNDAARSTDKKREKVVGRLISMAEGIRSEGNAMFKTMEYAQAEVKYSQAIHMLQKVCNVHTPVGLSLILCALYAGECVLFSLPGCSWAGMLQCPEDDRAAAAHSSRSYGAPAFRLLAHQSHLPAAVRLMGFPLVSICLSKSRQAVGLHNIAGMFPMASEIKICTYVAASSTASAKVGSLCDGANSASIKTRDTSEVDIYRLTCWV